MSWRSPKALDTRTTGKNHRARLKRWMNFKPPKGRYLIDQVVDRLVTELERHGFLWQEVYLDDPESPVVAHSIKLKRPNRPTREAINIDFGHRTATYALCDLNRLDESGKWDQVHVVRYQGDAYRATQFGILWYSIDRRLSRLAKDVDWLISIVPQMIAFIDHGEIGPNIRRRFDAR